MLPPFIAVLNIAATTIIYTLSLHDALPICARAAAVPALGGRDRRPAAVAPGQIDRLDRKSTRLNSSHTVISYAVFCLKKKIKSTNVGVDRAGAANDSLSVDSTYVRVVSFGTRASSLRSHVMPPTRAPVANALSSILCCRRSLLFLILRRPPSSTLFPYTTLFRSVPALPPSQLSAVAIGDQRPWLPGR